MDGVVYDRNIMSKAGELESPLRWESWQEDGDGYFGEVTQNGTVEEAIGELRDQLPRFQWHVFIKNKQASAYEADKM